MSVAQITKADFDRAKAEALALIEIFDYDEPPIDPVRIANDLGVQVYFAEFSQQDQGISGFFDAAENAIYVNRSEFPRRQTFTVAHELGHRMLHRDWAKSNEYQVLLRDDTEQRKNPIEQEANTFAANLLVPAHVLKQYYKRASVQELSDLFLVSVPVIRNRLKFEFGV